VAFTVPTDPNPPESVTVAYLSTASVMLYQIISALSEAKPTTVIISPARTLVSAAVFADCQAVTSFALVDRRAQTPTVVVTPATQRKLPSSIPI